MDLGSIFLVLALLLIVAIFIAKPIFDRRAVSVSKKEQTLSALLARRDRVLDGLQELDFDYSLGKIPESDYPVQRANLLQQGTEILKKLDALAPNYSNNNYKIKDLSSDIDTAIASKPTPSLEMAAGGNSRSPIPDDEIEVLIAARRRNQREKSAGFCPQCGRAVQKSDRFCSKCGTTL
jgi:hypothetical protein